MTIEAELGGFIDGLRHAKGVVADRLNAALFAAFVHALRAELSVIEWRSEYDDAAKFATQYERERNDAQAAELRALKNVERLTVELQAARKSAECDHSWAKLNGFPFYCVKCDVRAKRGSK